MMFDIAQATLLPHSLMTENIIWTILEFWLVTCWNKCVVLGIVDDMLNDLSSMTVYSMETDDLSHGNFFPTGALNSLLILLHVLPNYFLHKSIQTLHHMYVHLVTWKMTSFSMTSEIMHAKVYRRVQVCQISKMILAKMMECIIFDIKRKKILLQIPNDQLHFQEAIG